MRDHQIDRNSTVIHGIFRSESIRCMSHTHSDDIIHSSIHTCPCTTFVKSPCSKLLTHCKESSAKILLVLYKEHGLVGTVPPRS